MYKKVNTELKEKDISVLLYLMKHLNSNGYPPSVREICSQFDIKSTSTVFSILNKLQKKGYIKRVRSKTRAIEILEKTYLEFSNTKSNNKPSFQENIAIEQELIPIPVLGNIAAGQPIFAEENIEEYIPLPSSLIFGNNCFMLRVRGESMIDAGIFNNDLIIVDSSNKTPSRNKIVAALIDGDTATVKRFDTNDGLIILKPENKSYENLVYKPQDVQILGCVTGVFRMIT